MRVRFTIYNEEVENTVNDRLKKKLLCFERALSTLEGYEGWMIGTTTLHLDWQPKQGENEFCHTKLTPEIIKKGRSAIRVRIAAAEEEKERENGKTAPERPCPGKRENAAHESNYGTGQ